MAISLTGCAVVINLDAVLAGLAYPQLCQVYQGWPGRPMFVEPKVDGLRCLIFCERGRVKAFSRNGKPLWNMEHILGAIPEHPDYPDGYVLDGEVYAGDWSTTISVAKTQRSHRDRLKLKFYVFDFIGLDEWTSFKGHTPLWMRKGNLSDFLAMLGSGHVVWNDCYVAESQDELDSIFRQCLQHGWEGVVVKDPDAPYLFDQRAAWFKHKPENEADLVLCGVEEGRSRLAGTLGAIWVAGEVEYKGQKFQIDCRVGTGFLDEDRDRLWAMWERGELRGKIVQVKFQEVACANGGNGGYYALRFPVFVRLREDKS